MAEGIATTPPETDTFIWYREDRVTLALQRALEDAIEVHGNKAKPIAWDVRTRFKEIIRG